MEYETGTYMNVPFSRSTSKKGSTDNEKTSLLHFYNKVLFCLMDMKPEQHKKLHFMTSEWVKKGR